MKLSEFILLNEAEKKFTVVHEGILIAKRNSHHCLIFLFQMGSYYVETLCNRQSKAIEEFRAFNNVRQLNPYLEAIAIDDLME